jgi:hypothetical protein
LGDVAIIAVAAAEVREEEAIILPPGLVGVVFLRLVAIRSTFS